MPESAEIQQRSRWEHADYLAWCKELNEKKSVQNLITMAHVDQIAIKNSGASFLPSLDTLSATVLVDMNEGAKEYQVIYNGGNQDESGSTITISHGENHSVSLHLSTDDDLTIGYSSGVVRNSNPLLGATHSHCSYPFLVHPELRDYTEELLEKVSDVLVR